MERVKELESQRATTSRNSSKPLSSDGPARVPRSLRSTSGKKPGGQPEHRGAHLRLVDAPDHVVVQRPAVCPGCATALDGAAAVSVERRQVVEVPPVRAVVTEYQGVRVCCAHCQTITTGAFPADVTAPVQDGPRLRAIAVYLTHQQLLPYGRTRAVLGDLLGCVVSEGTLAALAQDAAERMAPVEAAIAAGLAANPSLTPGTGPPQRGRRKQSKAPRTRASSCGRLPLASGDSFRDSAVSAPAIYQRLPPAATQLAKN